jgi:uncharacterized protein (DUF58 family)
VRHAIAGLTLRGRAFLAAGITAVVSALLLGEPDLTRVGLLLAAVPLVAGWLLTRTRYRLALTRTVSPSVVEAGRPATVRLGLSNEGRAPQGALLLEDRVPYVLGDRPRFVLDGIGPGWRRDLDYQVRSEVRGRFTIGPMAVRVTDPFGMVELGRAFHTVAPLVVTPRVVPLPVIPLEGAFTGSGDNRPRAFATGSAEDVTVREYRRGDDLRRVHWRSSARVGELMVRREEQPWQARATVFLDHRAVSHRGQGAASSFETAVQVAASVGVHLGDRGYAVRLVTAAGEDPSTVWHTRAAEHNNGPLLEALAVVGRSESRRIDTGWLTEHGQGTLVVAVLGSLEDRDHGVLRRMRHHAGSALAVLLDVEGWGPARGSDPAAARWLAQQGWRTVVLGPGERLERVWERLGSTSPGSRTGRSA